ncbi:FAD:protein FMN transferase [bacterium]|nr:FAD:protein FMN transferase [bacterium]
MADTAGTVEIPGVGSRRASRFSHEAMATVFSLLVIHDDRRYAHQAAAAAWAECDRLEQEFSRFIENSDISRLNGLPLNSSITIGMDTYECLRISSEITMATGGAFDVTLGTAVRPAGSAPEPPFLFDPHTYTVTRTHPRAQIDLGGIGKGYAVDRIAGLLDEWEIPAALVSGGRSSVLALDPPPGEKGWRVSISHPATGTVLKELNLVRRCLSGSGLEKGEHILDPRTGKPVTGRIAAWSLCPAAAEGDALSTAFMVMDEEETGRFCKQRDECAAMIVDDHGEFRLFGECSP